MGVPIGGGSFRGLAATPMVAIAAGKKRSCGDAAADARKAEDAAGRAQDAADGTRPPQGSPIPAPRDLPAFPEATRARPKTPVQGGGGLRPRWKDRAGNIYEWDRQHGAVEKYNKRGRHLGEFDPNTGAQTKEADPTRTGGTMTWIIRGYRPGADDLQHEVNLDLVLKEVFRRLLGLPEGDELLDSYPLDAGAVRQVAARFDLDLDSTAADFFLDQDAPWPPSTGPGA